MKYNIAHNSWFWWKSFSFWSYRFSFKAESSEEVQKLAIGFNEFLLYWGRITGMVNIFPHSVVKKSDIENIRKEYILFEEEHLGENIKKAFRLMIQ